MPQPLAERHKVYTIGLDQLLRIFHSEEQHIFTLWKIHVFFRRFILGIRGGAGQPVD
jgi:hypothetical protein